MQHSPQTPLHQALFLLLLGVALCLLPQCSPPPQINETTNESNSISDASENPTNDSPTNTESSTPDDKPTPDDTPTPDLTERPPDTHPQDHATPDNTPVDNPTPQDNPPRDDPPRDNPPNDGPSIEGPPLDETPPETPPGPKSKTLQTPFCSGTTIRNESSKMTPSVGLHITPDGKSLLLVTGNPGSVQLWETARFLRVRRVLMAPLTASAIHPTGNKFVVALQRRALDFFDLPTIRRTQFYDLAKVAQSTKGTIPRVGFSPQGKRLAVQLTDPIYESSALFLEYPVTSIIWRFSYPNTPVRSFAFSPLKPLLYTGLTKGLIQSGDHEQRQPTINGQYKSKENKDVISLAFQPDGRYFASAYKGTAITTLWKNTIPPTVHKKLAITATSVLFHPNNKQLFVPSKDQVHIYNTTTGKKDGSIQANSKVRHIAVGPQGKTFALTTESGTLQVYRCTP